MRILSRVIPKTVAGQLIGVFALSFLSLLTSLVALEFYDQENVTEWAQNDITIARLHRVKLALANIDPKNTERFVETVSSCHRGYALTPTPLVLPNAITGPQEISDTLRRRLSLDEDQVIVTSAVLTASDFAFDKCEAGEIRLPVEGAVLSLRLESGAWLNAEIHPHEWHLHEETILWVFRSIAIFLVVGATTALFVRRVTRPLRSLSDAAESFGNGLNVSELEEVGPSDIKNTLQSFNEMQRRVSEEVDRRAKTLASISHDVRSPLAALRIKTELIEDDVVRSDLQQSIGKMERIVAMSLDFLRGESEREVLRTVDLVTLVESECDDFADLGFLVEYRGLDSRNYLCRPEALSRALRNLIENGLRYGNSVSVNLEKTDEHIVVSVVDDGPGMSDDEMKQAVDPFVRLSEAREAVTGGFGLGLTIAKEIAEGHGGTLRLSTNRPRGLRVDVLLPLEKDQERT